MREIPAEAFPPIEYLIEELNAREWCLSDLIARMPGEADVNRLQVELLYLENPEISLGEDLANKLAQALGTSAEIWLRLDETWRNWKASRN